MDLQEYSWDDAYFSLNDVGSSSWVSKDSDSAIMKNSVLDGIESLKQLPNTYKNRRKKKKPVKTELSAEVQRDLRLLKMRNALDPKRFYKRNASKGIKNNVQVGVVLDSPADFYHSRLPNKLRKNTLVDELLADAKFKKDIKRRYVKIIEEKKDRYRKKYNLMSKRKRGKDKKSSKK